MPQHASNTSTFAKRFPADDGSSRNACLKSPQGCDDKNKYRYKLSTWIQYHGNINTVHLLSISCDRSLGKRQPAAILEGSIGESPNTLLELHFYPNN